MSERDVERLAEVLSHALTDAEEWVKSAEVANLVDALLASDWLAAHDAEVAARALREAADRLDGRAPIIVNGLHANANRREWAAAWLRAHADRVAGHTPA